MYMNNRLFPFPVFAYARFIEWLLSIIPADVVILIISMVPVVELRGAIPIGIALGVPWYRVFLLSVIGNLIPVPFILILIDKVLILMKRIRYLDRFALWLEEKAEKNKEKITKYAVFGLLLFVGIPLPGTGAWTGALVASLLHMKKSRAMISIVGGVLLAGALVTLISYGVLGFLTFLL